MVARDGVAVDAEVAAAVAAYADGVQMNVAARCRELGIAPRTFYKYVGRFRERGVPGLFPDSRRPLSSPTRLPAAWEDLLVTVRKEEAEAGWDYGADAVLMRLEEQPRRWPDPGPLPSRATVNRVFEARGVLAKTPQRRPRRRYRRFERAEINALWQFDGFEYPLADGVKAIVLHLSDDCSRTDLALQAVTSENGADAWCTFCVAVDRYGLPAQMLSDNGLAFSGKRRGWTSDLERRLAVLGVQAITARVGHPQTCGKNERAHQRVQEVAGPPATGPGSGRAAAAAGYLPGGLQQPPQPGVRQAHPHQRFQLGPIAYPIDFDQPTVLTRHTVSATGSIGVDGHLIGLGRHHHGKTATVFRSGDHVVVFINDQLAETSPSTDAVTTSPRTASVTDVLRHMCYRCPETCVSDVLRLCVPDVLNTTRCSQHDWYDVLSRSRTVLLSGRCDAPVSLLASGEGGGSVGVVVGVPAGVVGAVVVEGPEETPSSRLVWPPSDQGWGWCASQ